jgi:hypothetical protein
MKHWYTWISKHYKYNWWNINIHEYQNTTSITGEILIYMNIFDIHVYQSFISYTCSVLIFIYINVSPVILVVFDIHVYQYFTSYTCSVLIFMYKYNWWNIDIHEYQTLQV